MADTGLLGARAGPYCTLIGSEGHGAVRHAALTMGQRLIGIVSTISPTLSASWCASLIISYRRQPVGRTRSRNRNLISRGRRERPDAHWSIRGIISANRNAIRFSNASAFSSVGSADTGKPSLSCPSRTEAIHCSMRSQYRSNA